MSRVGVFLILWAVVVTCSGMLYGMRRSHCLNLPWFRVHVPFAPFLLLASRVGLLGWRSVGAGVVSGDVQNACLRLIFCQWLVLQRLLEKSVFLCAFH